VEQKDYTPDHPVKMGEFVLAFLWVARYLNKANCMATDYSFEWRK